MSINSRYTADGPMSRGQSARPMRRQNQRLTGRQSNRAAPGGPTPGAEQRAPVGQCRSTRTSTARARNRRSWAPVGSSAVWGASRCGRALRAHPALRGVGCIAPPAPIYVRSVIVSGAGRGHGPCHRRFRLPCDNARRIRGAWAWPAYGLRGDNGRCVRREIVRARAAVVAPLSEARRYPG
jgi:hypothetical protein